MKNHSNSLAALLVLLMLFLVSFYFASDEDPLNFCRGKVSCIVELASHERNAELCSSINETNQSDLCYEWLAQKTASLKHCSKSTSYDRCVFAFSLSKNNPNYCDESKNTTYCYYSYALLTHNESLCSLSDSLKTLCFKKLHNQTLGP